MLPYRGEAERAGRYYWRCGDGCGDTHPLPRLGRTRGKCRRCIRSCGSLRRVGQKSSELIGAARRDRLERLVIDQRPGICGRALERDIVAKTLRTVLPGVKNIADIRERGRAVPGGIGGQ